MGIDRWDIQPDGVQWVLALTAGVVSGFDGQMKSRNKQLDGAIRQTILDSGIVAKAIADFAEAQLGTIQFVFAQTSASLNGAAQATSHYLEGDLEMAANAQRLANG